MPPSGKHFLLGEWPKHVEDGMAAERGASSGDEGTALSRPLSMGSLPRAALPRGRPPSAAGLFRCFHFHFLQLEKIQKTSPSGPLVFFFKQKTAYELPK